MGGSLTRRQWATRRDGLRRPHRREILVLGEPPTRGSTLPERRTTMSNTSTITAPTTTTETDYRAVPTASGYAVIANGVYVTERRGNVRSFVTPNAARSEERR